jgi:dihydrolipoamide dehydrogenase
MLAHKAEEEGVACVERLVNGYGHVNYDAIPGVCYTEPEIAAVGQTEEQLKEPAPLPQGGVLQFRANGRARRWARIDGRVKILAHEETDRVLGVHIIGPTPATSSPRPWPRSSSAPARTSRGCCHAHPTLAGVHQGSGPGRA